MKYEDGTKLYKITKSGLVKEVVLRQAYIFKGADGRREYCIAENIDEVIKKEKLMPYEEAKKTKIKLLEEELGIKLKEE